MLEYSYEHLLSHTNQLFIYVIEVWLIGALSGILDSGKYSDFEQQTSKSRIAFE